jgi:hypothetical protein
MVRDDGLSQDSDLSVATRSRREESPQIQVDQEMCLWSRKESVSRSVCEECCTLRTLGYGCNWISLEVLSVLLCKALFLLLVIPRQGLEV